VRRDAGLFAGFLVGRAANIARWCADDYERIGVSFETPNHFLKLTALENP
jgi:hypothetical protein